MSLMDLRDECEYCDRCNEEASSCYCYLILSWEGDHLLYGDDSNMDRIIDWGFALAIRGAPPRFDDPVLRDLPIHLAKAIESQCLLFAALPELASQTPEEVEEDPPYEAMACKKSIYEAWVHVAAVDYNSGRVQTGGDMPGNGGIYDIIEVENPTETLARMSAILLPAIKSLPQYTQEE